MAWSSDGTENAYLIDASDESNSNCMRYYNSGNSIDELKLRAFQFQGCIYTTVMKPIKKKAELLVWYGDEYAKHLELDPLDWKINRQHQKQNQV